MFYEVRNKLIIGFVILDVIILSVIIVGQFFIDGVVVFVQNFFNDFWNGFILEYFEIIFMGCQLKLGVELCLVGIYVMVLFLYVKVGDDVVDMVGVVVFCFYDDGGVFV